MLDLGKQRAWVEIDELALSHNVSQLRTLLAANTRLMAVVKADAYGHGALNVARIVLEAGCSALAIATLAEGIELRQGGITAPIIILGAIAGVEEVLEAIKWQLEPTLCSFEQAKIFAQATQELDRSLSVHLKIDTGMSRLGVSWEKAIKFVSFVDRLPNLTIASVYSHLATADSADPAILELQHQRFEEIITSLKSQGLEPPFLHLANSAATLSDRALHYDLVRVGLAIYGLYPAPYLNHALELRPVLQVKAKVTQVKPILAGTGISYGYKYIAEKDLLIAVVGIGYADGVPRNLSNRLKAIVRGKLVSQIGAITMDQLMLDVTEIPDLRSGEIVTLIGREDNLEISADDWANQLGTIVWEILCGFKHRLPRLKKLPYHT
jgi:alanine racemase